jgi:hypothetical protein
VSTGETAPGEHAASVSDAQISSSPSIGSLAEAPSASATGSRSRGRITLKESRENYYYHSGKVSDIARQLGFAAIALIWVFRVQLPSGRYVVPTRLLVPGLPAVIALSLDFLHYIAGSLAWGVYSRQQERQGKAETDLVAPSDSINWPALFLFWAKVALIVATYVLLLVYLFQQIT